ncbi:hypothetical protein PENTCL1PPCAC_10306, partial [Pristionchus entomophagus]
VSQEMTEEEPAQFPDSQMEKPDEVQEPPRSASADLPETEQADLHPPPKDRSNSHCFGSPISALLNKLRRQSSYDVRQVRTDRPPTNSSGPGFISSTQDGVSRAARRSIHGLSSAFASLRGKKEAEEEIVFVFNFVSPTLFLYGKDLKQAATKKLAEWDKLDASRSKEEKELRETVTRHFIVDCSAFIFLDNTGAASMTQTYKEMSARNIKVYYAAARESVRGFFLDLDEADRVPPSAFYPTVDCATQVAKAYKDSPPRIMISGLPDDGPLEDSDSHKELHSDEEETFSLLYYLPGVQDVNNLLIAVDRFIALHYPMTYQNAFKQCRRTFFLPSAALAYSVIHIFPNIGSSVFTVEITFGQEVEPVSWFLINKSRTSLFLQWILFKTLTPPILMLITNTQMRRELSSMFYLPGVQDVVNLQIALNRFCALCSPLAYRRIFTRINTYIMIPLGLVYSIIYIFPIIGAFGLAIDLAPANHTYPV